MSKAFTKEDAELPERSGRVRSASGLPPGATNYITSRGAAQLEHELKELRRSGAGKAERIVELEQILNSITIIDPPGDPDDSVGFGAKVSIRDGAHKVRAYRILGLDELNLDPNAISWISPLGRSLLSAKLGDAVSLDDGALGEIVKIEYPME